MKKKIILGLVIFLTIAQLITWVISLPEEPEEPEGSEQYSTKNMLERFLDFFRELFKTEEPVKEEDLWFNEEDDRIWYSN